MPAVNVGSIRITTTFKTQIRYTKTGEMRRDTYMYTSYRNTATGKTATAADLKAAGIIPFGVSGKELWCLSEYVEPLVIKSVGGAKLRHQPRDLEKLCGKRAEEFRVRQAIATLDFQKAQNIPVGKL